MLFRSHLPRILSFSRLLSFIVAEACSICAKSFSFYVHLTYDSPFFSYSEKLMQIFFVRSLSSRYQTIMRMNNTKK